MNFANVQFGDDMDILEEAKNVVEIVKDLSDQSKPLVIQKSLKNYAYGSLALGLVFKSQLFAIVGIGLLWMESQKKK
jgi:hypothetical protein